ncbi:MAG: hypothetical protein Q4G43_14205 [Mobilicoccus sp.]|nr:hypothetical protein [Mobilicoccus sp.]
MTPDPDGYDAARRRAVTTDELRTLQRLTMGMGALMAILLLVIHAAGGSGLGLLLGLVAYSIAMSVMLRRSDVVRVAPRGFGRRYGLGIAGTSAMYGLGVALTASEPIGWGFVAVLAVLTFVPALVAAWSMTALLRPTERPQHPEDPQG